VRLDPLDAAGRSAVVTGAGSGIGRAVAIGLAEPGSRVGVVGRRTDALEAVARDIARRAAEPFVLAADLIAPKGVEGLARDIAERLGDIDVLVHSAGVFPADRSGDADALAHTGAAGVLTRALLPGLRRKKGQVVFINSSVGRPLATTGSAYAESKQALRVLADQLRDEVNGDGIRVLTVYPGRTATPMQEMIHRREGRPYCPERLLQPEDVASVIRHALELPARAEVTDVFIRPMLAPT
jgi:NADP-dependent 3-hydroxy acid dehydrogenase YdfG